MEKESLPASRMSGWETAAVLLWLPIHILGLPVLLLWLVPGLSGVGLNFWNYVAGTTLLSLLCVRFLRRDFDRLWERPLRILGQALLGYALILGCNLILSLLLRGVLPEDNPNNQAVLNLARGDLRRIGAVTVILAPILEELIFRGGVFGLLRRRSRFAAYGVCLLLFGLYHTWQFALQDPICWLYLLEYLPAGFFLCRSYEKTECIWTAVFLHMLNNGVSLLALLQMGG